MSSKSKKKSKFTPKSGNPSKRSKEIEEHKATQELLIEKKRANKAYTERMDGNNYVPRDVGGLYTPPDFITRIEQMEAPRPKPKGKVDKRKLWGGIVGVFALGAMVFSGFQGLESAFSPVNQQQQVTNQQQQGQLFDQNGNTILVDRNGNPIDGSQLTSTSPTDGGQVLDSQVLEIPAQETETDSKDSGKDEKKATDTKTTDAKDSK